MGRFTGPDGPYEPGFTWPDGICGRQVGEFVVESLYGRDVPGPAPLLCVLEPGHEEDHLTRLTWCE